MTTEARHVHFADEGEKARWLDAAASLDARHPAVAAKAHGIVRYWRGYFDAARRLFEFCHRLRYRTDAGDGQPGVEEFADAATVLARGYDDCDGKARCFVALVRALDVGGLEARIVPVFKGQRFRHVQAEVRWPGSEHERAAGTVRHADAAGWIPCELILARAHFGDLPEDVPREPDGRWRTT